MNLCWGFIESVLPGGQDGLASTRGSTSQQKGLVRDRGERDDGLMGQGCPSAGGATVCRETRLAQHHLELMSLFTSGFWQVLVGGGLQVRRR